jgi:DNA-binding CsgD family transcriptional regulator
MSKSLSLSNKPTEPDSNFPDQPFVYFWKLPQSTESEPHKLVIALRERIKELNCLYGISQLAEKYSDSIDNLLKELVNFLPYSWQYPEYACSKITYNNKIYKSKEFKNTKWQQASPILLFNNKVGEVSIFYTQECPPADEGPFLKEERVLIEAIAERVGNILLRISMEKELQETNRQLKVERQTLKETNAALRTVMAQIEAEKKEISQNIQQNVEKILIPILHALSLEIPKAQMNYIELLKTNLEEITSPFVNQLSKKYHSLTPTEIKICNMIKNGLRTKEIAQVLSISSATVNRHREHIRKKLQIANHQVNLTTYLQSTMLQ